MKPLLPFVLLSLFSLSGLSQERLQDVIYLKNGNVLRGTIIEQVPSEYVILRTSEGSEFTFSFEEIDRITKEENPVFLLSTAVERRGYIGITVGASIPVGEFNDISNGAADTGLMLNLINAGFLINEKFGIGFTWFGASNPLDIPVYDPWSYGGLLVGPIFTTKPGEKVEIDTRLLLGYFSATVPDLGFGTERAGSIGLDLGGLIRYNISQGLALLITVDYLSANLEFTGYGFTQQFSVISINAGLALRF